MKFHHKFKLNLIYSLATIFILGTFINVNAQDNNILNDQTNPLNFSPSESSDNPLIIVFKGKDDPAPGRRKKGADFSGSSKENKCTSDNVNLPLTALVYGVKKVEKADEIKDEYLLNFTAQEKPSFWFYIPYKSLDKNQPLLSKLRLISEEGNLLFEQNYPLPEKSGIQEISLPANSPSLEMDKKYYWEFHVLCNLKDNSDNPWVYGTIKRVKFNSNLIVSNNVNPLEKAKFYAENGLWNETITTIIKEIYPVNKKLGQFLLNELLKSVDLEEFSEQEITS